MITKQLSKWIPLLAMCFLLTACGSSANSATSENPEYKVTPIDEYTYSGSIKLDFKEPKGLALLNDTLYVADSGNHRIAKIKDVNSTKPLVDYFGQIGSSPGDLLGPQAIITDGKEYIYVADAGNSRIQVFNTEDQFIREYPLKLSANPETIIQDLSFLDENHLVLSLKSIESKYAHLYLLNIETGEIEDIKGNITGFLTNSFGGEILALAQLELYSTDKNDGGRSGNHAIYKVAADKITQIAVLPQHYTPTDGIIIGDYLYASSQAFLSIDKFALDGTHLGTVYRPDDANDTKKEPHYKFTFMTSDQQYIYVSDTKNNTVVLLKNKTS